MESEEKRTLKEKLTEKGIDLGKAAEEVKVPEQILGLYLKEDSFPVPKRIINGLNNLIQ